MKLLEILNKDVEYKVIANQDGHFETTAVIGDRSITFQAFTIEFLEKSGRNVAPNFKARFKHRKVLKEKPTAWYILFFETKPDKNGKMVNTIEKTGSGRELEVFSFIKKSWDQLMKKSPSYILFSALKTEESENRVTLYTKMVNRYASNFSVRKHEDGNKVDFELARKKDEA